MPQAAIAAVANFFIAAGVSAATSAFLAEVFVYAATTYLLNRAAEALTPRSRSTGLGSGTEVNYYDSAAPVRIVYGQVKTGGMETIPPTAGGINNVLLHKVLTLAGHEVDSYNFTHFDSTTITNAQIGTFAFTGSDGMVSSGTYGDHAFIRRYRGTSTDSGDRMLMDANSVAFGNFRGRGIAKAAVGFKFNQEIYGSVPTVTFTYQGKRCYDPRLDVTPGASPTNASYIAWTRNVALCLTDYLMSELGGGYAAVDIDWDTVVTAANYCDGSVNIPGPSTQARYTCNGVLFATDEFSENVRSLVNAMLGRVIFRDGKWRVFAGSWQTPTFTIQKSDWISGLSIRFEQGKRKRFNQIRTWYVDPAREWQRVESLPRTNATYKAADGAELLDAETEQLMCTSEFEAQRKGEFLLRQSRNQIVVAGRLPPRFQDIALWDTGTIVFDHLDWSSKTFRCVGCDMNPDGSMDVVFSEEQSTDWTDMDAADYNSPSTAALPLINVTSPSEPLGFSATPQINGTILFDWTAPIVKPFNTQFQIIRSTNSANAAVGTVVWQGLANPVPLVMPTSPHWYYARAIANSTFSAYSPNTYGVYAIARLESDRNEFQNFIPDGELRFTASSSLWDTNEFEATSGWTGNLFSVTAASYSPTGGIDGGGYITLTTGVTTTNYQSASLRSVYVTNSLGRPAVNAPFCVEVDAKVRVDSSMYFGGSPNANTLYFGMDVTYSTPSSAFLRRSQLSLYDNVLVPAAPTLGQILNYKKRFVIQLGPNANGLAQSSSTTNIRFVPIVSFTSSPGMLTLFGMKVRDLGNTNAPELTSTTAGNVSLQWADTMVRLICDNGSISRGISWVDEYWSTLVPVGARWHVAKPQLAMPVFINPSSGMTMRLMGATTVGTVTMVASLAAQATIEKVSNTEVSVFGNGLI